MRNLIRRAAMLAGAMTVLLGTGAATAQPAPPSAGGSPRPAPTADRCSPGAPGLGYYNGKVCIGTTPVAGGFAMKDPARPGLSCGENAPPPFEPFTQPHDTWGDGEPADLTTACVDAMYAAADMWDMLRAWFGRDGFDGQGHAARIEVGHIKNRAFFGHDQGTGAPIVVLGQAGNADTNQPDPLGRQRSSMDIVAHEFGHMVSSTTPGAWNDTVENQALNEGASDIFAQLTIAFAGNPRVPLTYTVGSQFGKPFRVMYRPSLGTQDDPTGPEGATGGLDCYSPVIFAKFGHQVAIGEQYPLAGPLNHWFYLLAEGSAPVSLPASPTCDGSALTGLGIRLAGTIFYNGLLLKTTHWKYRDARWATLTAAKQLFPGSCTVFDKVKAAWNAVSVPARPDEPACTTPIGPTVPVTG